MSARNRELLALVPASLLVAAGFAAIFIQESQRLSDVSLTYGGGLPRRLRRHPPRRADPRCPTRTRTCSRSPRCSPASGWS